MTNAQTHALRCSEIRQRLNEISGMEGDAFTDEVRAESDTLSTEYRDVETKYRAALVSEGDDASLAGSQFGATGSSEDRAYRELVLKTDVGAIFEAVVEKRSTTGATAELQQHHKLTSHQVPLDVLRGPSGEEHRAVATVPANVETAQQPTILPVFATGDMAYLGVDQPSVPTGDAVFPVLTTRPAVHGPFTGSNEATETDATFTGDLLKPSRVQAAFRYLRTDAARFAGMAESLRSALNEGLGEALDREGITGTHGLLTGTNLANHAASAVTTFAKYISDFAYSRVDGRFAARRQDLKVLCGSGAYAHAGSVYKDAKTDLSALDKLTSVVGDVRVSAHVPAVSAHKQNGVIRLGARRDMIQPLWEGITLILSESDEALVKKGEILITAVLIHATKIIRANGFHKQQTQHA